MEYLWFGSSLGLSSVWFDGGKDEGVHPLLEEKHLIRSWGALCGRQRTHRQQGPLLLKNTGTEAVSTWFTGTYMPVQHNIIGSDPDRHLSSYSTRTIKLVKGRLCY